MPVSTDTRGYRAANSCIGLVLFRNGRMFLAKRENLLIVGDITGHLRAIEVLMKSIVHPLCPGCLQL